MNQVTNLIQWKNLTQEQKDDFDERYRYEVQHTCETKWKTKQDISGFCSESTYRLVIEDDKWYCWEDRGGDSGTYLGKDLNVNACTLLRPARPDEIPQDERTLERKIEDKWPDKEVVMLESENGMLRIVKYIGGCEYDSPHVFAQSIKGFYKYVYEHKHDDGNVDLISTNRPNKNWKGKTILPVAALFEVQK